MLRFRGIGHPAKVYLYASVAVALFVWGFLIFAGPMYSPGEGAVAGRSLLPANKSKDGMFWELGDGAVLRQFSQGKGGRQVVYLHGGPGGPNNRSVLGPKCSGEGGSCTINYFHQRGCGQSTRPFPGFKKNETMFNNMKALEGVLGIGAQLADLEQVRLALPNPANRTNGAPLTLVGHSWGGFLAAMYAIEFPEDVERLVLIAPADVLQIPRTDGRPDLFKKMREVLPADANFTEFDEVVAEFLDFDLVNKTELDLQGRWLKFAKFADLCTEGRYNTPAEGDMATVGGWMGTAQFFSLGIVHDYRSELAAIKCPVLLVHGSEDLMPVEATLEYQSYLTGSSRVELNVIKGAGHFPYLDAPDLLNSILDGFIGS